jgi:hypothetical protein
MLDHGVSEVPLSETHESVIQHFRGLENPVIMLILSK